MPGRIGSFLISGQGLSSVQQTVSRFWRYYICCFSQRLKTHQETWLIFYLARMSQFLPSQPTTGSRIKGILNMMKKILKLIKRKPCQPKTT